MIVTLAKSLKMKNRLVSKIRKVDGDIAAFNSLPAQTEHLNQPRTVVRAINVRKLYEQRQQLVKSLLELKTKIIEANAPIWPKILMMAEIKVEIDFWKSVDVKDGRHISGFRAAEIFEYDADFKKSEVDEIVSRLEMQLDELQDAIDAYNYSTTINF